MSILEVYVVHAGTQGVKLEELNFKNLKYAILKDIDNNRTFDPREKKRFQLHFQEILAPERICKSVDKIFEILTHDLTMKFTDCFFTLDKEDPDNTHPKFFGEYLSGGIFDIFIRKCSLSFNKMMFEEVVKMHDDFKKYVKKEQVNIQHASSSLELYFNQKLQKFESEVIQNSHDTLKEEFENINGGKLDYKKWLLHSMNDAYAGYSIPAIENLRRYIDYSLEGKAEEMGKNSKDSIYPIHNSIIPVSHMHIKLGNLDEALISLIECIKLSQNKKDNLGIVKCLIWLQEIVKEFGNIEQAQMLILEQILVQWEKFNMPQIFNSMALEYSQLITNFKPLDPGQNVSRIKSVRTEEKKQDQVNNKDDIVSLLMYSTQKNLLEMYQPEFQKEIKNYHIDFKPMYNCVRSFQWGNEGEKALMLANVNSLAFNYPEGIKNIDVLDSLYQVILKLAKNHPEELSQLEDSKQVEPSEFLQNTFSNYLEALAPSQKTKSSFNFTKLCLEHIEALKKFRFDHCRTIEDLMLSYNEKSNSQTDYSIIWEWRLQRLFKEEFYDNALTSAKDFLKFWEKQGFMLKKLEYELFIAKINQKSDAFQEALFQTLKIIEKAEEWQMSILSLEAKILMADIHCDMNSFYDAITQLNEIEAEVFGKCSPETKANFYITRAKAILYLSTEIETNEVGAVFMKKSVIVDLEECIKMCDRLNLFQQLREALMLKSLICYNLAELYLDRKKEEQWEEYNLLSESSAKEFNNIEQHIEDIKNQAELKIIQI